MTFTSNEKHKPNCKINRACAVYHADGVCPGPYGKCTCYEEPVSNEKTRCCPKCINEGSHGQWTGCTNTSCQCHQEIDALVRDLTKVGSISKSEVKRRLTDLLSRVEKEAREVENKIMATAIEMSHEGWIEEGAQQERTRIKTALDGMKMKMKGHECGIKRCPHYPRTEAWNAAIDAALEVVEKEI